MSTPEPAEPDTKDWTWVLDRPCPDCGFDAADVEPGDLGERVRSDAALWAVALREPGPSRRRRPTTWSTLEYAGHVRDVNRTFATRVRLVLDEDAPLFADWDQDAAALEADDARADPDAVRVDLAEAAERVAALYDAVPAGSPAWSRPARRSNGSVFTLASLGRYHLHDLVHHAWDVRGAVTVGSYEVAAEGYRAASAALTAPVRARIDELASHLPAGARVLEIGSGGGRDAAALEVRGLDVRRTDVTPAFVDRLRGEGHEADVLDPLTDDLTDPRRPGTTYDAVWANACLLHVDRADLPVVLARLATATRPGGLLMASVKEGDGEAWSTHGTVATPRHFVYWREPALREVLLGAGWDVEQVTSRDGLRGERWLMVTARMRASAS